MGIFSKLFGTKDSTPAIKDYSFIARYCHIYYGQ